MRLATSIFPSLVQTNVPSLSDFVPHQHVFGIVAIWCLSNLPLDSRLNVGSRGLLSTSTFGGLMVLPLALLGLGGTPLTSGSRGSSGTPLVVGTIPVSTLSTSETRSGSLPVTASLNSTSGNSSRADLVSTSELLLLDLLLGLSLGVTVCKQVSSKCGNGLAAWWWWRYIQK